MLDFLDDVKIIDEENYSFIMQTEVEPYLENRREDIYFLSFDNKKLHCEVYKKRLSRGNIIILHGFTESAEKFREVAYYFRKAGYSVFVPDLRGHGKSYRVSLKKETVEEDNFALYAEDITTLIEKVIRISDPKGKIYIYSHSLGSTAALLYMLENPFTIQKAVLSSPMICGNMGMPVAVAGAAAKLLCKLGGKGISAPGRCVFDPMQKFADSDAVSEARFLYYLDKRKKEPLYQTNGPSFSWVKASVEARDKILSGYKNKKVGTELLIFKPEEDKQLLGEYTDRFAELCDIKTKIVKNSKHEIFMSKNQVLQWYFEKILDFISD